MTELRSRDLAFTPAEAQAFLTQAAGVSVSPEATVHLERQMEGWAAGLRLAALSLREEGGASSTRWTTCSIRHPAAVLERLRHHGAGQHRTF